jgi:hypothetical protein
LRAAPRPLRRAAPRKLLLTTTPTTPTPAPLPAIQTQKALADRATWLHGDSLRFLVSLDLV